MPQRVDIGTKLLIHGDGLVDDYVIKDQCGRVVTVVGNTTLSTSSKKFGKTSINTDGNGDYISISPVYNPLTEPFTIDLWYDISVFTNKFIIAAWNAGSYGLDIYNNKIRISSNGTSLNVADASINLSSGLHHLAVVFSGTNWYVFQDGVQKYTVASTGGVCSLTTLEFMGSYIGTGYSIDGYISEIRITEKALWIGGTNGDTYFSPPETPARGRRGWY